MIVEKTFEVLKNRWRLLLDHRMKVSLDTVAYVVPAIVAMHNFCINVGDGFNPGWQEIYNHKEERERYPLTPDDIACSATNKTYAKNMRNILETWTREHYSNNNPAQP